MTTVRLNFEPVRPASHMEVVMRSVTLLACSIGAILALMALIGWMTGIEFFKSFLHPNHVAMNPVTAVAFLLAAVSLYLQRASECTGCNAVGRKLALVLSLIVLIKLVSLFIPMPFQIDRLLFNAELGENRMAPNTAICFLLIGMAMLWLDTPFRGHFWLAQVLAVMAALLASLSLIGYILDTISLYRFNAFIPMALNTSVGLVALAAGILAVRPDRDPVATLISDSIGGKIGRLMIPAAFAIPLGLAWLRLQGERRGLYGSEFGVSVFVLGTILVFNTLVWWNTRWLHQLDVARKAADAELQASNDQLSSAVKAERTALDALRSAQSQLVQTEKLASLGQMVAGIAHEINNPLAFVNNNVTVLNRDAEGLAQVIQLYEKGKPVLDTHAAELAREIRELSERVDVDYTVKNLKDIGSRTKEGLRRIQQIIKDLREFARLDRNQGQSADVNAGIELTLNIIASHAKKNGVELRHDLAKIPATFCFPAKLNQVVMNLLTNAIDATPQNGVVSIRTISHDDALEIQVSDTGSGIPPEIRERIFDPFFTTKPVGSGTGLGLSISYGIVKEHGGTISVQSEVGKGSTFIVHLPVRVTDKSEGQPTGAA